VYWHSVPHTMKVVSLTFKQPGWYLNFISWFFKNVLFEQKKIDYEINILWKIKWIMHHVLKMRLFSLLPKYIKWISRSVFFRCLYICKHRSLKFNENIPIVKSGLANSCLIQLLLRTVCNKEILYHCHFLPLLWHVQGQLK